MPDSTIQIVAYWERGDKYDYDYTETKYKIENGQMVVLSTKTLVKTLEIVDSTANSYTLRFTERGMQLSDTLKQQQLERLNVSTNNIPVMIQTDEMGSVEKILNLDECITEMGKFAKPMALAIYEGFTEEQRLKMPFDRLCEAIKTMICDPNTVSTTILQDISRLLYYHGTRLNIGEEYSFAEELHSMLGGGTTYGRTKFWVDEEFTSESHALMRSYTQIDAMEVTTNMLSNTHKSLGLNLPDQVYIDFAGTKKLDVEQYSSVEVHLDSGWPVSAIQTRDAILSDNEGNQTVARITTELTLRE
jgi:hypothetical protein